MTMLREATADKWGCVRSSPVASGLYRHVRPHQPGLSGLSHLVLVSHQPRAVPACQNLRHGAKRRKPPKVPECPQCPQVPSWSCTFFTLVAYLSHLPCTVLSLSLAGAAFVPAALFYLSHHPVISHQLVLWALRRSPMPAHDPQP